MKISLLHEGRAIRFSNDMAQFLNGATEALMNRIGASEQEALQSISQHSGLSPIKAKDYLNRGFWTFGEKVLSRYVDGERYGSKFVSIWINPTQLKVPQFDDNSNISAGAHLTADTRRLFKRGPSNDHEYKVSVYIDPSKNLPNKELLNVLRHELTHVFDPKIDMPHKFPSGHKTNEEYWGSPKEQDAYITMLANQFVGDGIEWLMKKWDLSREEAIDTMRHRNIANPRLTQMPRGYIPLYWKEHKPEAWRKFLRALYDILNEQ